MEIGRDIFLSKLIRKKHNGMIKVITGIRRCGKSYLLRTLFRNHLLQIGVDQDHIFEMAFDIRSSRQYLDPDVFDAFARSKIVDDKMYYFLLDEVQLLEDFESVLNGLMQYSNVDIYVTGSNAKFLSKDVITEFRGRGDEIHMTPLSFAEFMKIYPGDKRDGFEEYLLYGGLPPVVLLDNNEDKLTLLQSLLTETYIKDILTRYKIRNKSELDELLNMISSNIGTLINPEKLKNTFRSVKKSKITSSTISKYLEYLSDAYIIEAAHRYDVKGKAYIETPMKYYYSDLGLRNARINFRQIEVTHSMENVIYNELRRRGFNVDIGSVTISDMNHKGVYIRKQLEVDFVCNKGSKRYYVQSAYVLPDDKKRNQELRPLRNIEDSFKKIIITNDSPGTFYNDDGILFMNTFDFLLDQDSLDI